MAAPDFSAPVSRTSEVLAGLAISIPGAALLILGIFLLFRIYQLHFDRDAAVLLSVVFGLGLLLFVPGFRLLTGKRRRDGGLFSPWTLRVAGLMFLAFPIFVLFISPTIVGLLKAGFSVAAGVACFALANRRQDQSIQPSASVPNQRLERP